MKILVIIGIIAIVTVALYIGFIIHCINKVTEYEKA